MSAVIKALVNGTALVDDAALDEIIELGTKALRERESDKLVFDLLALDGVRLPLKATAFAIDGKRWLTMAPRWLGRLRGRSKLTLYGAGAP
jgi:hypothetical protein